MAKKNDGLVRMVSILAVLALFAVSGMVLVNIGVLVYKNIAESNLENYQLRTSLSYVKTKINQADEAGLVVLKDTDKGEALVLSEEIGGDIIDTVIYYYDGSVREFTHSHSDSFNPEDGFEIIKVDDFSIKQEGDNLIKLSAKDKDGDTETLYTAVRTGM
jgi:hypothetical protein